MTISNGKRAFGLQDLAEFRARIDELRRNLDPPTAAGEFVAYTDGACLGNPEGPGGWAAVVDRPDGDTPWMLFGHLSSTSNNRAAPWCSRVYRLCVITASKLPVWT